MFLQHSGAVMLKNRYYSGLLKRVISFIERVKFRHQSSPIKKNSLLLLRLDSIGDYVLFRNFIEILRKSGKYKEYHITLCGNSWWKNMAENLDSEFIDEFIWIDYFKMLKFRYRFGIYTKIHSRGFEVLVHPTYSRDAISDNLVMHSGASEKIGYSGEGTNLTAFQKIRNNEGYTKLVHSTIEFEFYRNRYFFEQLLAQKLTIDRPTINGFSIIENKIVICPGAKDGFRRWAAGNFVKLSKLLSVLFPDEEFVLCGSAQDNKIAEEIIENSECRFTNYSGKLDLMQLVKVLSEARLVISNDSGPFHIAVALGKKVVCISNGNNYGKFSPYPLEMKTQSCVIYPSEVMDVPEKDRLQKFCREVRNIDINEITAEAVYEQVKELVNK